MSLTKEDFDFVDMLFDKFKQNIDTEMFDLNDDDSINIALDFNQLELDLTQNV